MAHQVDNAIESTAGYRANTTVPTDNLYSARARAQQSADQFVLSMKDRYQQLKATPNGKVNADVDSEHTVNIDTISQQTLATGTRMSSVSSAQ